MIEHEYGINDQQIKHAIYYHTTGRPRMSRFEMILFIADYIEPGRDFPGVDNVREAVQQSLEQATWKSLQQTIQFLSGKGREIYPDTFHAYNYYTKRITGGHWLMEEKELIQIIAKACDDKLAKHSVELAKKED